MWLAVAVRQMLFSLNFNGFNCLVLYCYMFLLAAFIDMIKSSIKMRDVNSLRMNCLIFYITENENNSFFKLIVA